MWALLMVAYAAEPGFDAHGPKLAAHDADLRDLLFVQRPGVMVAGDFFASVMLEYARQPLVETVRSQEGVLRETALVDDLATAHLSIGAAFHERLRLDLLAPLHATSLTPTGREGPTMGDLRLTSLVSLLPPESVEGRGGGLGLGVVGHMDLPSGDPARFLGRGQIAGGARLAATWELTRVTFSADGGAEFAPDLANPALPGGSSVVGGFGMGVLVRKGGSLNLEAIARSPFTPPAEPRTGFAAEAALSIRGRGKTGVFWTLGGAGGLTEGASVATFRAFLSFGYGRHALGRTADADSEGSLVVLDACPLERETENGWKDDDGCPDELGALAVDVRYRGQSWPASVTLNGPDGESTYELGASGITLDAAPESRWTASAKAPCLAGSGTAFASSDGSALVVDLDPVREGSAFLVVLSEQGDLVENGRAVWQSEVSACVPEGPQLLSDGTRLEPLGPGTHTVTVTADGFSSAEAVVRVAKGAQAEVEIVLAPTRVRIESGRIVILERVFFETAKAGIKSESFSLLDEVSATILTTPAIGRIEIAGHTDNQGTLAYNQRLSQARAEAVRDYLQGKGVPRERLIPVGYGESRPVGTNRTDAGREGNRRVEFNLLDAPREEP